MNQTFSISQIAQETGVSAYTLRYYEEIGLLPPVQRNGSSHRAYTAEDVAWIEWLKMLRHSGMSIQMMLEFVALTQAGPETIAARCDILSAHREDLSRRIAELQGYLARLDRKLEYFRGAQLELAQQRRQTSG